MRKIEINYQNTTELISNLMTILTHLDVEKESVKKALNEINDLENNHTYESQIIYDLEYGLNQINRDIQDTEDLIKSINTFSKNIQETDERLAQKFKQDIKSYAKQNNIELVSEFDKWLDKAQMALDGFGLIPGVGEIADGVNGLIYLFKGDIKNAGISFLSMIPEVGDTAKGVRYFDKASDILKYTDKAVDLENSSKKLLKATDKLEIKDIDFNIFTKKINFKKFNDTDLEVKYRKYVIRKKKEGKVPRNKSDWKECREYWLNNSPMARGNRFNKKAVKERWYPYNEIHLENGKRLDSYDKVAGEIISRKATDLDKISFKQFDKYLKELKNKYAEGTVIRSNKYSEIDGEKLTGTQILEIPKSNEKLDNIEDFIKYAEKKYKIKIRFRSE